MRTHGAPRPGPAGRPATRPTACRPNLSRTPHDRQMRFCWSIRQQHRRVDLRRAPVAESMEAGAGGQLRIDRTRKAGRPVSINSGLEHPALCSSGRPEALVFDICPDLVQRRRVTRRGELDMDSSDAATCSCILACSSWLRALGALGRLRLQPRCVVSTACRACWAAPQGLVVQLLQVCPSSAPRRPAGWRGWPSAFDSAALAWSPARGPVGQHQAWRACACSRSIVTEPAVSFISSWRWLPIPPRPAAPGLVLALQPSSMACWICTLRVGLLMSLQQKFRG